jgi:LacI family transcriptional regulator
MSRKNGESQLNIREVADHIGVSRSTVSNVLNGREDQVSPETRDRVLNAVRKLGYRPAAAPKRGAPANTRNISVMMSDWGDSPIVGNGYYGEITDGIFGAVSRTGWSVTFFLDVAWNNIHRELRDFVDGRSDGMLLVAPSIESPVIAALRERGTPFVVLGSTFGDPEISEVDINNRVGAAMAVEHLAENGHRRIAHFAGQAGQSSAELRREGFGKALLDLGLDPEACPVLEGGYTNEDGERLAVHCVESGLVKEITAVFCANDGSAMGALKAFLRLGIRVPEDISIVGFDGSFILGSSPVPLTSLRQPFREISGQAVSLLKDRVRTSRPSVAHIHFNPDLVVGDSVLDIRRHRRPSAHPTIGGLKK